jgi:hypothetical protein
MELCVYDEYINYKKVGQNRAAMMGADLNEMEKAF